MKIKYLIIAVLTFGLLACENQVNEFDDFGSTSVYFPFQTPVRTIIQGKYDLGFNDNDNNGRFEIGVTMSGVYNNSEDRKVHFELAPELIDATVLGVDTVNVELLPASYYTIEQESPVTIPSGSIKGRIPVQLSDAFFDDPKSFAKFEEVHYVIPLKITNYEGLDSLLTGVPAEGVTNPFKIKAEDWETLPKDYTLFGIKYMNKYQGIYLRRGEDAVKGFVGLETVFANGNPTESETRVIDSSSVYRSEYVVGDDLLPLSTAGRKEANTSIGVRRSDPDLATNNTLSLKLTFNDNEEITVTNADPNSTVSVIGTGKFVEDGDEWGGKTRDVIYLDFEYRELEVEVTEKRFFGRLISTTTATLDLLHTVKDTLVIRDRDVKFEEFTINLEK